MPTDPTPERVREWARATSRTDRRALAREVMAMWKREAEYERATGILIARLDALARQVIALREIAEEAINRGCPNPHCIDETCQSLRARLAALGGG